MQTRSLDGVDCSCTVCSIGRLNGNQYQAYLKDKVSPPGRPKVGPEPSNVKRCDLCYSEIGRGKPHNCGEKERHDNLIQMVKNNGSDKVSKQVTSNLLKNICSDKNVSTKGGTVSLATEGTPLQERNEEKCTVNLGKMIRTWMKIAVWT